MRANLSTIYPDMDTADRFWAKVDKTDECWVWKAHRNKGYGQFSMGGRAGGMRAAHRISYEWANGPIPPGKSVDHRCHNRACVNPAHLRLVDGHKQNAENLAGAHRDCRSGVRGVRWHAGRWEAYVGHNNKVLYLGRFDTIDEAEAVVVAKRNELFTHNDMDRV